mgnify:CR=1 FL=1
MPFSAALTRTPEGELHVRPDAQGGGLGEGLLRALLAGTDRAHVLLSTPEHGPRPPGREAFCAWPEF